MEIQANINRFQKCAYKYRFPSHANSLMILPVSQCMDSLFSGHQAALAFCIVPSSLFNKPLHMDEKDPMYLWSLPTRGKSYTI